MERDYHGELRGILEQLVRIADLLEASDKRAARAEPLATEVLEMSARASRKLAQEADI